MLNTRTTLLIRLKSEDREADWEDFYDLYGQVILRYAQKLGLDEDDAFDVLQETMTILMRKLKTFTYDPHQGKFRNYLLTIVHRCALGSMRRTSRREEVSADALGGDGSSLLESLAAPDLTGADEQNHTWQQSVLEHGLDILQRDTSIKPTTLQVFIANSVHNRPASEVAKRFGIKENAVYQIKNRMLERLRKEIHPLTSDER